MMINLPLPLDLEPLAAAGALPLEVAEEHAHATVSEGLCARCLVGTHHACRQRPQKPIWGPSEPWRCVCFCQATNGRQNGVQR